MMWMKRTAHVLVPAWIATMPWRTDDGLKPRKNFCSCTPQSHLSGFGSKKNCLNFVFILCVQVFRLQVCLGTTFVQWPGRPGQCAGGLLELESQMVMIHHVGTGNPTLIFLKSSQCSYLTSHLSSSECGFFKDIFIENLQQFIFIK